MKIQMLRLLLLLWWCLYYHPGMSGHDDVGDDVEDKDDDDNDGDVRHSGVSASSSTILLFRSCRNGQHQQEQYQPQKPSQQLQQPQSSEVEDDVRPFWIISSHAISQLSKLNVYYSQEF
mmetsp:Transcript_40013/g.96617  ORF Transcript_40013/g.96617 Transcript_40013/m.96617 type:complete len:119 (+) Transcript_40013:1215-1571(+)